MEKITKPELAHYFHATLFRPITTSLLKEINMGFLNKCVGLTERLIKKNIEKSINTTMDNLNIRRQGIQSTRKKPPDIDLEDKCNTNLVLCTTVDLSTTKEGEIYSKLCGHFPITPNKENK